MERKPNSSFENSEMLASFLASTPQLSESWKLSKQSNTASPNGFLTCEVDGVIYVAFSGVQLVHSSLGKLVHLVNSNDGDFAALYRQEEEDVVMVDGLCLRLFFSVFNTASFRNLMFELLNKGKAVIFTGHSVGGAIASLSSLWLLSYLRPASCPISVLCITFGSPLIGNKSLSRAILQERWGSKFCHLVAKNDIVPRIMLAPVSLVAAHLPSFFQSLQFNMSSLYFREEGALLSQHDNSYLYRVVVEYVGGLAEETVAATSLLWPFGNFMFCSKDGSVCIDDGVSIIKLLGLTFTLCTPIYSIENHLNYEDYVSVRFLDREELNGSESSYEAGIKLALQSTGISSHEPVAASVKHCLEMAKQTGRNRNLICASLAIDLSKITPLRAQIEWYKRSCDMSDDKLGYYDSFKQRSASKRDFKANMNRMKLGKFWDDVIQKWETNQLPHDFHKRAKWVNATLFYRLLVEPLDIAEYYRNGTHRVKGHYIAHGRDRRYEIFDRWWKEKNVTVESDGARSKFASLTQDSCFWAKVEEAREWLDCVRTECNLQSQSQLWERIHMFELYSRDLHDKKELSEDVMADNSSYTLWLKELKVIKDVVGAAHDAKSRPMLTVK